MKVKFNDKDNININIDGIERDLIICGLKEHKKILEERIKKNNSEKDKKKLETVKMMMIRLVNAQKKEYEKMSDDDLSNVEKIFAKLS